MEQIGVEKTRSREEKTGESEGKSGDRRERRGEAGGRSGERRARVEEQLLLSAESQASARRSARLKIGGSFSTLHLNNI